MKHLIFLTGAGISAESGISTFRDANGLWEGHDIMEVASLDGFNKNSSLVFNFYNQRRRQLLTVEPNNAHYSIAALEKKFKVTVITQNVDDLHERAGSNNVIHLHGELLKARSTVNEELVYDWKDDLNAGSLDEFGDQLRPHIVWFGEAVPEMETAINLIQKADIVVVVGTSLQVYPAAGLINYADKATHFFYIDQNPVNINYFDKPLTVLKNKATEGMKKLEELLSNSV